MTYLKTVLTVLFTLICLLSGYIYFTFDDRYFLSEARQCLLAGDAQKSLDYLCRFHGKKYKDTVSLYTGYALRSEGFLRKAHEEFLRSALSENKTIAQEARYNILLDDYLAGDYDSLEKDLETYDLLPAGKSFFLALTAYEKSSFSEALQHYLDQKESLFISPLYEWAHQTVFPPSFGLFFRARCLIESFRPAEGRLLLEKSDLSETPDYLIGLSFLREGEEMPLPEALPYYQKAFEYFSRLPLRQGKCDKEKKVILSSYERLLTLMQTHGLYEELIPFLEFSEDFGADMLPTAELFLGKIRDDLRREEEEKMMLITEKLLYSLRQSKYKEKFSEKMMLHIEELLEAGREDKAKKFLALHPIFSSHFRRDKQKLSESIYRRVKEDIEKEPVPMEKIDRYLAFWNELEQDPHARADYCLRLLPSLESLWEKDPFLGLRFAKQLDSWTFPEQKKSLHQKIGAILDTTEKKINLKDPHIKTSFSEARQLFPREDDL